MNSALPVPSSFQALSIHTHLVFAASREEEFVMKIKGATYAEIASKGGGILNSARKLQETSADELFERHANTGT